jgi:hypothetical protein
LAAQSELPVTQAPSTSGRKGQQSGAVAIQTEES